MLPFLDKKKIVSVVSARMGKGKSIDVKPEAEAADGKLPDGLKMAADDLLRAIESKSVIDIGSALKAAFEALDDIEDQSSDEVIDR